MIELIVNI